MKRKLLILSTIFIALISLSMIGCSVFDSTTTEPIDLNKVSIDIRTNSYEYTGAEICPGFKVLYNNATIADFTKNKDHEDLQVKYENNINVGTASIIITPKTDSKNYIGSKTLKFTIFSVTRTANDATTLIDYLNDKNNPRVVLANDVVIPKDAQININNVTSFYTNGYKLINNGSIIVNGSININNKEERISTIENNGTIVFNNKMNPSILNADRNTIFYNKGELSLYSNNINGNREALSCLYSDTPILDLNGEVLYENPSPSSNYFYVRKPLSSLDILVNENVDYTGNEIIPSIVIKVPNTNNGLALVNNCTLTFSNNVDVGRASVTIKATEHSKFFLGEVTKEFNIVKSDIIINENEYNLLDEKLNNLNYNSITLVGNYPNNITVPKDANLIIKDATLLPDIINNGTLTITSDQKDLLLKINNITNNGVVNCDVNSMLLHGNLKGNGTYNSSSEVYLEEQANVSNIKLNQTNKLYYNLDSQVEGLDTANNNYIKREKFDTYKHLSINNDHVKFNNSAQIMDYSFKKNGVEIECLSSTYKLTMQTGICNAGQYIFNFKFYPTSKDFYGQDEGYFNVDKTSIVLGENNNLEETLNSNNYNNITLTTQTFIPSGKRTIIPEDTTLIIGESAALYNTTYNGDIHNIESCLVLLGKIINNGIYAELGHRNLSLRLPKDEDIEGTDVGVFENHGTAYFNIVTEENKAAISKYGTSYPMLLGGETVTRKSITLASMTTVNDICEFAFKDGHRDYEKMTPEYNLQVEGNKLLKGNNRADLNADFVTVGYNNQHVSISNDISKYYTNSPYSITSACYCSRNIYGQLSRMPYTIKPGKTTASNYDEFKKKLECQVELYYVSEFSNETYQYGDWEEITFTNDIIYNGTSKEYLTIPTNLTIKAGNHKIDLSSNRAKTYLVNTGRIYTSAPGYDFNLSEYSSKNGGKIIGEAQTAEELLDFTDYDEVILMADIDKINGDNHIDLNLNNPGKYCTGRFIIHLNGHKITLPIFVDVHFRSISIDDTEDNKNTTKGYLDWLILKGAYIAKTQHNIQRTIYINEITIYQLDFDTSYEEKYTTLTNVSLIKPIRIGATMEVPMD